MEKMRDQKHDGEGETLRRLFSVYCFWGLSATVLFLFFLLLFLRTVSAEQAGLGNLALLLLAGFSLLGATSFSRHAYIRVKNYMGRRVGVVEFLSTQLVALLFPYFYFRTRKEIQNYRLRREGRRHAETIAREGAPPR
jgi:hypothetical protein